MVAADYGPLAEAFLREYMYDKVDKAFGIGYESGKFMIGDKVIEIQGDDIEIDGEMDMSTSDLWALITERTPTEYTSEDYERCKELLYEYMMKKAYC